MIGPLDGLNLFVSAAGLLLDRELIIDLVGGLIATGRFWHRKSHCFDVYKLHLKDKGDLG